MEHTKHEVNCFLSVQKRIDKIVESAVYDRKKGIPIVTESKLGNLITSLSCTPAATFTATHGNYKAIADLKIQVDGEDVGTFGSPDIEKILQKSKPSAFGRGEETVLDPDYRNGREIEASHIVIGGKDQDYEKRHLFTSIEQHIAESLFIGRAVKINLYKLAIYGQDGHFDWHRDTTHADDHHATVLVALNTEWTGGDFVLRHGDETVDIDMHPFKSAEKFARPLDATGDSDEEDSLAADSDLDDDKSMQAPPEDLHTTFKFVAFYTDVEHKVEPITEGHRLVLQFDVTVGEEEKDDEEAWGETSKLIKDLHRHGNAVYADFQTLFANTGNTSREDTLQTIVSGIAKLHAAEKPIFPVVIPLRHLYRCASISEGHLKGVDKILYTRLQETFGVVLAPLLLVETEEPDDREARCYPLPSKYEKAAHRDILSLKKATKARLFLPARYQLATISQKEYIEYTGNEAQLGEARYYGGGMFISPTKA